MRTQEDHRTNEEIIYTKIQERFHHSPMAYIKFVLLRIQRGEQRRYEPANFIVVIASNIQINRL